MSTTVINLNYSAEAEYINNFLPEMVRENRIDNLRLSILAYREEYVLTWNPETKLKQFQAQDELVNLLTQQALEVAVPEHRYSFRRDKMLGNEVTYYK